MRIDKSDDKDSQIFKEGLRFQEKEWAIRDEERDFNNRTESYFVYNLINEGIAASAKVKVWGGVFQVQSFIVAKERRGMGHGKKLLDRLLEEAKNYNCHSFYVSTLGANREAVNFYNKNGLNKIAEIPNTFFGTSLVILTKNLN